MRNEDFETYSDLSVPYIFLMSVFSFLFFFPCLHVSLPLALRPFLQPQQPSGSTSVSLEISAEQGGYS